MRITIRALMATGAGALAFGVAACVDDDRPATAPPPAATTAVKVLALQIGGSAQRPTLTAPASSPAGLTRIQVTTTAKTRINGVQILRFDAGRTARQALTEAEAWASESKPLPPWIHLEGGVTALDTKPTSVSTRVLPAGSYVAFGVDDDEATKAGSPREPSAAFQVTPDSRGGELPAPAAQVTMKEYAFEARGLTAGRQQLLVDNVGKEPHFIVGLPLKPGRTVADARAYYAPAARRPAVPEPVDLKRSFNTAILDGGSQQVVDVDLDEGAYVFLCFVPDRAGGPVHVAKGMISAVTVRPRRPR